MQTESQFHALFGPHFDVVSKYFAACSDVLRERIVQEEMVNCALVQNGLSTNLSLVQDCDYDECVSFITVLVQLEQCGSSESDGFTKVPLAYTPRSQMIHHHLHAAFKSHDWTYVEKLFRHDLFRDHLVLIAYLYFSRVLFV